MSDDFQLRKDIDKIDRFISQLDTSISDKGYDNFDGLLEEYGKSFEYLDTLFTDMNTLSTDLQDLQTSLIEFNDALINFSDDNTNFANNLSKLKENLNKVLSQISEIGEGSSEFSDALAEFDIDITTFVNTLWGLEGDLSTLSDYITEFEGDLVEFQAELVDADIDTEILDTDIGKLIGAMAQVRSRTSTAEQNIGDLKDDIGDATDYDPATATDPPEGIAQWSKWLQYKIGSDDPNNPTGLIAEIIRLTNQIGTENDTADDDTIFGNIAKASGNITTIRNKIYGVGGSESDLKSDGIMFKINNIVDNDIPDAQRGIANYKTAMFGSSTGSESNYTADSIYGRMYAILHKDANNNEVGRLPTMEASMTSATTRLNALLDTSVTPNTGRIPNLENRTTTAEGRLDNILDTSVTPNTGRIPSLETRTTGAEGRLDRITNNNGTGTLDVLESKIGNDGSGNTAKTGLYLLIDNVSSTLNNISTTVIGSDTNQTPQGSLWHMVRDIRDNKIGNDGSNGSAKTGLYLLIDNTTTALNNINTNIIGSDSSTTPNGSLWAMIRDIRNNKIGNDGSNNTAKTGIYALIDGLQTSINTAQNVMGTTDRTNTTLYNDDTTVWWKIRNLLTNIGIAQKNIDAIKTPSHKYTKVWIGSAPISQQDIDIITNDYTTDLSEVIYAVSYSNSKYKKINSSWAMNNWASGISDFTGYIGYVYDYTNLQNIQYPVGGIYDVKTQQYFEWNGTSWVVATVNFDDTILGDEIAKISDFLDDLIGFVCYTPSLAQVSKGTFTHNSTTYFEVKDNFEYDYVYVTSTQKYYRIGGYTVSGVTRYGWTEYVNPLFSQFPNSALYSAIDSYFAEINHNHNTWTPITVTYGSCYVNTAIRMVELYYNEGASSFTNKSGWADATGVIPSEYRPLTDVYCHCSNATTLGMVEASTGKIRGVHTNNTSTGLTFHATWHY